ncbi:hypothetical protein GCM10012275_35240 [Longimycelium tulufanense]|uniref:Uncharacterized protein n=1 Tax=Longimycelium tulufanense TaxID=907463 RepID=A0A8J3FUR3_9PSEU|nr:hypothetical protein [Longimycelium tulufanense]GGM61135.1 hypothetical protein GCM10012275_35240 [Longimycelium tulufanense]
MRADRLGYWFPRGELAEDAPRDLHTEALSTVDRAATERVLRRPARFSVCRPE